MSQNIDHLNLERLSSFLEDLLKEKIELLKPCEEKETSVESLHQVVHKVAQDNFRAAAGAVGFNQGICSFFLMSFQMGRQFERLEKKTTVDIDELYKLFQKEI